MKEIASRDNPDFRALIRASEGRRAPGERPGGPQRVALEGIHLCESWLDSLGQPELAFIDADRTSHPEVAAILTRLDDRRVRLCASGLLRHASQVVHGQGILFLCDAPAPRIPERIAENCMWLDRVQDPGNMGTLLRTAAAAGIRQVYASTGCVAAWSPKVVRSAQGAHFVLDIHEGCNLVDACSRLDVPLIVTSLDNAVSLYAPGVPQAGAWVFGNEGKGVDPALIARADLRLFIPQSAAVESLNVGVAAGICLFEQRRLHPPNQ